MDDEIESLKSSRGDLDLQARILDAEVISQTRKLRQIQATIKSIDERLEKLTAVVFVPTPPTGQTIITLPVGNSVVGT